ncbi:hypothetical protein HMPREF3226_02037 [Prevotella corporis]|uniref:Uncharacterized protein n=1 Tax=Prevotella corporis TaxID=28128 RepID=A0A133PZ49_9BACT|nr:hypothetical protein HMPREF3226_02037 [Prevotella corporis]
MTHVKTVDLRQQKVCLWAVNQAFACPDGLFFLTLQRFNK